MRRTIYSTLAGIAFLLAGAAHATAETPNEVIESAVVELATALELAATFQGIAQNHPDHLRALGR